MNLERRIWRSCAHARWRVEIEENAECRNLKVVPGQIEQKEGSHLSVSIPALLGGLRVERRAKRAQLGSFGAQRSLPIVGLSRANRGRQG